MLAEEALTAEGFYIYRYPITGLDIRNFCTDFFHDANHLVTYGDTGNSSWHRAMLDVQVTRADRSKRYPDDCIPRIYYLRLRLVGQGKLAVFNIG